MLNSGFLGVAIGLILVYFLLSLLVSGVNEVIEIFWQRRARYLEVGIWELLGPLTSDFYNHHLVQGLKPQKGLARRVPAARPAGRSAIHVLDAGHTKQSNPSYIPSSVFSNVVSDILTVGQLASTTLTSAIAEDDAAPTVSIANAPGFPAAPFGVSIGKESFVVSSIAANGWSLTRTDKSKAMAHPAGETIRIIPSAAPDAATFLAGLEGALGSAALPYSLGQPLQAFLNTANHDVERWRTDVEKWFDDKMERLSGWYKRKTKWILFVIGAVLVVALNADTVVFAQTLWKDATIRASVEQQAQSYATTPPSCSSDSEGSTNDTACVVQVLNDVKALNLPLGWGNGPANPKDLDLWLKGLGLLLSAVALSFGAPFWFDLLNKVTNLRAGAAPPKQASESTK
jgi:hypothetical protein